MSLRTADYDFDLPDALIARRPPERREAARMLVLDRAAGTWAHRAFTDFPCYVRRDRGDLAVLNDARVRPARVFANGGRLELLVLEIDPEEPGHWVCLVKPGRRARVGATVRVGESVGVVEAVQEDRDGARVIRFDHPPDLEAAGTLPLPPYLDRPRADAADRERYQTVFARRETAGAIAAPTAGLHFTPEILAAVPHAFVTLDVGVGTFRPVKAEDLREHRMHAERFEISAATADAVNGCPRARGGRLFAVGTTSLRVLSGCARDPAGNVLAQRGATDIFLHPPLPVTAADALLTNFHLPRSTLLMLVSAMAGRDFVLAAYWEAVREGYRFFSYGDCMLVL